MTLLSVLVINEGNFQQEFLSLYYPSQAEAAASLKVQKQLSKLIIAAVNIKTSTAINYSLQFH